MLTLQPKTTRIMSINNNNNISFSTTCKAPQKAGGFFGDPAGNQIAPHSPTRLIGDPALPAALKEYHVSVN